MKYLYINNNLFIPHKLEKKGKFIGKGLPILYKCTDFISLDTETSHNNNTGWIYQWAFSYPIDSENRFIVYGRTPSELVDCLEKIIKVNELDDNNVIDIFVHNLSYDYQYIKDWLETKFEKKGNILAVKLHSLIGYNINGLNFKCSYKLSNRSLNQWSKDLNVKHKKLVDYIDYEKRNYQDSKLYKRDWKYMFRDIICLDECIVAQNELFNDTIFTMPSTYTGYIRRYTRNKFKEDKSNAYYFKESELNAETYDLLVLSYTGALCHGNRFYMGKKVTGRIRHRDFVSHYPTQQIWGKCPTGQWSIHTYNDLTTKDIEKLSKNYCCLITMQIKNLKVKKGVTFPILSSHIIERNTMKKLHIIEDNGRVLKCDDEFFLVLNEYDLDILKRQYNFDYQITSVRTNPKGDFPEYIKETVKYFLIEKTKWKKEKAKYKKGTPEYENAEIHLQLAKSLLNAIYGMTATKTIRQNFYEDINGMWQTYTAGTKEEKEQLLHKYYNSEKNFMTFDLGCYVTSQAKKELIDFIELIGYENVLYCDTDSAFYISNDEIEEKIEAKNKEFRDIADEKELYVMYNGEKIYLNQFALEDEKITEFKFLRAKTYAYVTEDGTLNSTIAGVCAYGYSGKSRENELKSIDNLKTGMKFIDCGGRQISYINNITPELVNIDGHLTEVASSAIIKRNIKTLTCPEDVMDDYELNYEMEI